MAGKPSGRIKASKKASFRTIRESRAVARRVSSRSVPDVPEADADLRLDSAVLEAARHRAAGVREAGVRHRSLARFLATPEAREGYVEGEAAQWAADLIREMRKRRGLSQAGLAKHMNVEASRIGEMERGVGRYGPTLGKLKQVANACGFKLVVGFE